jgi:predicted DNA-binding transcriptional regulator AlpA
MNAPNERRHRRRVGVIEIAAKLGCHPASIPRLVKEGRLPQPAKLLNRNCWWEDVIDAVIENGIPPRPKQKKTA